MDTRIPAFLLGLALAPSCGEAAPDPAAPPLDEALGECRGAGACADGEACVAEVCVEEPTRAATLGGSATEGEGVPVTGCWTRPEATPGSPERVTLRGLVHGLEGGGSVQGLCVTVYDADVLLSHLRSTSRCPGLTDPAARTRCFAHDGCTCAGEVGPDRRQCEEDRGPELGHTLVPRPDGAFEVADLPADRPLVLQVGGLPTFRTTYAWGASTRTDRLRRDDGTYVWAEPRVLAHAGWTGVPDGLSVEQAEDAAVALGEVRDCGAPGRAPRAVGSATVGLVTDPAALGYPAGDTWDPAADATSAEGRFAAVGLPAGANRIAAAVRIADEVRLGGRLDVFAVPGAALWLGFEGRAAWRE